MRVRPGCRATKRWTPEGGEDYDAGYRFDAAVKPLESLADLASLLGELRARPNMFVVRGQPNALRGVVRRSRGHDAPFTEVARYWTMLDVDGAESAGFTEDPANAAAVIREQLPHEFRVASCYWHASSSAGFKPGVRLHLWFWLSRPVRSEEWRTWVRSWAIKVDWQIYKTVQPHYTADPILDGVKDPMTLRSGILPGEPEVDLSRATTINAKQLAIAEKTLTSAMWAIKHASEGARNDTLYRQAGKVAAYEALLPKDVRQRLIAASSLLAPEASATVASAFASTAPALNSGSSIWTMHLQPMANGAWLPNIGNIVDVVELHPDLDGALATDERTRTPLWLRPRPWDPYAPVPSPLTDADGGSLAHWLDRACHFSGAPRTVALDVLIGVAGKHQIDPFRDYLESLEWDGIPRLETWLIDCASAEDSAFTRAVSKRWLLSAAARTFQPGCKADCALVLCGAQGRGKSTLLRDLAGPGFFAELQTKLASDDAYLQLQGPVIVELPELAAMRRADIETVKADLSTAIDRRRPKYGRLVEARPRRFVYAGTSNRNTILHDETGGRRFWPVGIDQITFGWMTQHRDQLWAEAVARYRAGEQWHLTAEEEIPAKLEQESRRAIGLLEEELESVLRTKQPLIGSFAQADQMDSDGRILRITQRQLTEPLALRIDDVAVGFQLASAFRALGWRHHRTSTVRYWECPKGWHRT